MKRCILPTLLLLTFIVAALAAADPAPLEQPPNTWVKRSPLPGGPPSPALAYEGSMGYDPVNKVVIRWAGHNQGGGGEQNAETWTFDPVSARWTIKEPNTSPPGACCNNQNVFDPVQNRFIRFPAFSGSHGWHWFRENYLSNTTIWNYDLRTNTWRDMRPVPAPRVSPLRCASWDSDHQVVVVFGGEGNQEGTVVYDPYTNTWTRMNPKVQPDFRSGGSMAYDAERKLHILFGAQFTNDPHTWAYDLRKNEWRDMKPEKMPPTDRNDAVLAYDAASKVVIAVVQVVDQSDGKEVAGAHHETWAYDAGKNTWTKMNPPREPDGWGNRRRIMVAIPDQNLILMEMYVNPTLRVAGVEREQQIWTYRFADAKLEVAPRPPTGVKVATSGKSATVEWQADGPGVRYEVYRGEGNRPWVVDYQKVAVAAAGGKASITDDNLKPGTINHYFVRAVTANGLADSIKLRTQPRIVEDIVVSVLSPKEVKLSWKAPHHPDIVGYHVERAIVEVFSEDQITRLRKDTPPLPEPSVGAIKAVGKFVRLTQQPVKEPMFVDTTVDLSRPQAVEGDPVSIHRFGKDQVDPTGKPYRYAVFAYRVRAVNSLGVESGDSPYLLTIPSSPRWVFSKEDGDDCQLKWAANPEEKLAGYRVYRMESPRINGPGQKCTRLTSAPVADTRYTDVKIGKDIVVLVVVLIAAALRG
jgi:hypothetical protein